ncbi:MAG TPA: hypothetical protein VFJ09_10145 [Nocardioidaceae bacterium]|nr:hypothetical protein [Nocardioidaceae bacterium]
MARPARALTLVVAWLVATAVVGAVTWTAVSRLGTDGATAVLSSAEVHHRLATSPPTGPSAPRSQLIPLGVLRTGKDPAARSQPRPRSSSWQLTGGAVGASCRGSKIRLLYASPRDGWAYRLEGLAVSSLAVGFTRGQARADLEARCEHGVPTRVDEPEADDHHERE